MEQANFINFKRELKTICDAAGQALRFNLLKADGGQVCLSTDYSLVSGSVRSPWLLTDHSQGHMAGGFDRDMNRVGRRIFELYPKYAETTPYQIVLPQPTVMEFKIANDRLTHDVGSILSQTTSDLDALYDALMRYIDSEGGAFDGNDQSLYQKAKRTFELVNDTLDPQATQNLLDMIKQGYVHGLGSYFTRDQFLERKTDIYKLTRTIWDVLNEKKQVEGKTKKFYVNNFMDALNFALASVLNTVRDDVLLSYVTPFQSRLDREDVIRDTVKQRTTPGSLLLDLSARELTAGLENPNKEAFDWLKTCFERAELCRSYTTTVDNVFDMSDVRKREVQFFYDDYMKPTFGNQRSSESAEDGFKRARALFSDKASFKNRFEQVTSVASQTVAALDGLAPLWESEELFSDMNLMDDPEFQEVARKLGIKKVQPPSP